jgi:divalent metal cation (Fe/Co/Zn/Cd) transporter
VRAIEKLAARRVGTGYRVIVHVQAAPELSLADAHSLGGRVKHAMCHTGLRVDSVLVHMEPHLDGDAGTIVQSTHHSAG